MVGGKAGGREPEARPALARHWSSPWGRLLIPKEQEEPGAGGCAEAGPPPCGSKRARTPTDCVPGSLGLLRKAPST